VHPEEKESFKRSLRDHANVEVTDFIADVEEVIKRHLLVSKRSTDSTFDYLKFNTWEAIRAELQRIADERPDLARLEVIGTTVEGREMFVLRLSRNITDVPTKPIVLIDGGIHAREWVSVSTAMYLINEIVSNPADDTLTNAFLDSFDFVIMPVLNPDGYAYTWSDDRLWRKNRAPNNHSTCIGVDLNRQWAFEWGGLGTSGNPCQVDFRGYAPFSELETQAVKTWIEQHRHKIVLYINFHAYGQLWMTPYGYSTTRPSNEAEMIKYSKIAVEAIKEMRGTSYNYGPVYTTIYPASSISVDWVRGAEKILIAYTVELPDKGLHGFLTPESEIGPIGRETWHGIKQLLLALGDEKNLLRTTEMVIV
jgi:hypothetical protein